MNATNDTNTAASVRCAKCDQANPPQSAKCVQCGARLQVHCRKCGRTNLRVQATCENCGRRLHRPLWRRVYYRLAHLPFRIKAYEIFFVAIALLVLYFLLRRWTNISVSPSWPQSPQ